MSLYALHLANGRTSNTGVLRLMGRLLSGSGVIESTAFTVSAQLTPDMTVKVSGSTVSDNLVIITAGGDTYHGWNTANANVTITSNATGVTKKDHIVAYVDTALTTTTPDNPTGLVLIAVRGTGTAAPTDGEINTATGSKPWIRLAEISVSNGAGSINSGNIIDKRIVAGISGAGIVTLPVLRQNDTTNAQKNATKILTGWGQIVGDDSFDISETVTFGLTFAAAPIVYASPLGFKTSPAATDIGNFATAGGSKTIMISPTSITTTSFSAFMTIAGTGSDSAQAFASSGYWGYSWIALGETA